jgi:putative membrane protein
LVVASAIYIGSTIHKKNLATLFAGLIGIAIAYFITVASPAEGPKTGWYVFLTGSIAICAMILPGISGSFILLLMGMYEYILSALHELKLSVVLLFMGGAAVGLISFSHLLSWLLKKYHDITVAVLAGFMIGSLNKVWPWKEVLESKIIDGEEKVLKEANLLPQTFTERTGEPHQLLWCILLMIIGFILIYSLERLSGKKSKLV